jgi:hypothetical protein
MEVHVETPVIDGFYGQGEFAGRGGAGDSGKAGHAADRHEV